MTDLTKKEISLLQEALIYPFERELAARRQRFRDIKTLMFDHFFKESPVTNQEVTLHMDDKGELTISGIMGSGHRFGPFKAP